MSEAPASEPAIEPPPTPPVAITVDDDEDDDLPAVGKVWSSGSESLSTLMAKHRAASAGAPTPTPAAESEPAPVTAPPGNVEPVDTENLPVLWQTMLDLLAAHGPMLHSLISQGKLVGIEDDRVILRFSPQNETFVKQWEKNGKRDLICEAASKALNKSIGVKFEIETDATPAPAPERNKPTVPAAKRPAAVPAPAVERTMPEVPAIKITPELVEELAKTTPIIRTVMQKLGGQVVKVE